jgi:hypothetical protein
LAAFSGPPSYSKYICGTTLIFNLLKSIV